MSPDDLPNASEQELLEFFWCEPVKLDDVVAYTVTDDRGIELRFSFNYDSIQTMLSLNGTVLETVCHEMLEIFRVYDSTLRASCQYENGRVELELTIRPRISVRWSGLRTR